MELFFAILSLLAAAMLAGGTLGLFFCCIGAMIGIWSHRFSDKYGDIAEKISITCLILFLMGVALLPIVVHFAPVTN